ATFTTSEINISTTFSLVSVSTDACTAAASGFAEITIDDTGCGYNVPSNIYTYASILAPAAVCKPFNDTTTLVADYLKLKQTTDYTTTPIPYVPFYSMLGGTQVPVSVDDTWATPVTAIPFNF